MDENGEARASTRPGSRVGRAHGGGRVVRSTRLARWRPAWDVDVERRRTAAAAPRAGEREPRIVMPYRIADEVATHDLLEAHGVPGTARVRPLRRPVRARDGSTPGNVDLSFADDDERERLLDDYLEILARIYAIPLSAAAEPRFELPADSAATASGASGEMEALYEPSMEGLPADPVAVFLRRWMRENIPHDRHNAGAVHHVRLVPVHVRESRITGLLDFEHAHVGDPMMDLAALRVRDTHQEHRRPLARPRARYEAVTGVAIDHDVVEYHTVLYNALSVISTGPPLADRCRGTDWLSYLAWYVNGARWAFETIAEIRGYELDPVVDPGAATRAATRPALRHLVDGLRGASAARRRRLRAGRPRAGRQPPQARRRDRRGPGRRRPRRPGRRARLPARPRRGRRRARRLRRARAVPSTRRSSCACSTRGRNECT